MFNKFTLNPLIECTNSSVTYFKRFAFNSSIECANKDVSIIVNINQVQKLRYRICLIN